ncbi:hypothetical protein BC936DRAFT_148115 [Jimgerdemannia flammicorona]|uniref:Protein kinase domain-containing protein n=1 Tax=Jimgerdemannia flammicorona TaxID=994334 RepID=A0A433D3T4_9FUNG|nr:hypothetical protein BC936DRAFT_148115 [Jimgerdemannia flammicorona]
MYPLLIILYSHTHSLATGNMHVMPRNLKELLEAIICILQVLVVMHSGDNPIFHQDIQWFNII